jgi:hypothetical protein
VSRELTILVTHEPSSSFLPSGWKAMAPGRGSTYHPNPWAAIAEAIWNWHHAGRPAQGRILYAPVHPRAVGSVADEARAVYAAAHRRLL